MYRESFEAVVGTWPLAVMTRRWSVVPGEAVGWRLRDRCLYQGGAMAEARDVMVQLTGVRTGSSDLDGAARSSRGRQRLIDYMRQFFNAFPGTDYQSLHMYESGNAAIDAGYYIGTNTGSLVLPSGGSIPATGRR